MDQRLRGPCRRGENHRQINQVIYYCYGQGLIDFYQFVVSSGNNLLRNCYWKLFTNGYTLTICITMQLRILLLWSTIIICNEHHNRGCHRPVRKACQEESGIVVPRS